MNNKEIFYSTLEKNLKNNMSLRPYLFKLDFRSTFINMTKAIDRGRIHTIGLSIRQTCIDLGINNTQKNIKDFIK